jgi:hypothetical protein
MDGQQTHNGDGATMPGGLGGESAQPGARDSRMVEKAVRQRWPITPEKRAVIAEALIAIAGNKRSSVRNRTVAARVLVQMDAQNMEQEKRDRGIPDRLHLTIDDITGLSDDELVRRYQEKVRALGLG